MYKRNKKKLCSVNQISPSFYQKFLDPTGPPRPRCFPYLPYLPLHPCLYFLFPLSYRLKNFRLMLQGSRSHPEKSSPGEANVEIEK